MGLDALESVGKKTMERLSAGDPGLRRKRSLLTGGPKPNLSQVCDAEYQPLLVCSQINNKCDHSVVALACDIINTVL